MLHCVPSNNYCETIIIRQTLIFVYFVSRPIDEFKFLTNNYVQCLNKIKTELPLTWDIKIPNVIHAYILCLFLNQV